MRTEVCETFGIEFPIFAFSHCRDVVAAVTNAGGMGVLGATTFSPEALEVELTRIDQQTNRKPYGVDLLLPTNYADIARTQGRQPFPPEHESFVQDLLARYHVPELPEHVPDHDGTIQVSAQSASTLLDVAFQHPIQLVASALGPPTAELIERAHRRNVTVAALVGTPEHARRQQAAGVDLIVAQGT